MSRPAVTLALVLLACGGGEDDTANQAHPLVDPAGLYAQLAREACAAKERCAAGAGLAGCGAAVVPEDCADWLGTAGLQAAATYAAGESCYYGQLPGFSGETSLASRCVDELREVTAESPLCRSAAEATSACEGVTAGEPGGDAPEAPAFLALPAACTCAVVPAGEELPPVCRTLLAETELSACTGLVGDGARCGETACDGCVDDDGNGATDCGDRTCRGTAVCAGALAAEVDCADGQDEDRDCATDCDDPDCAEACDREAPALCPVDA